MDQKKEQFYQPPPEYGKWEGMRIFFYNTETGEILGRTCSSWAKILLFYIIFYLALSAFFGVMFLIFYQTLDSTQPKWKLDKSLVGTNPGLGFRPMPGESTVDSTLIWYKHNDEGNFRIWSEQLDRDLQAYNKSGVGQRYQENRMNCDHGRPAERGKVCDVEVKNWHPCTAGNFYNYNKGAPCIFLKLNKIYGWIPEFYNNTEDLPKDHFPNDLRNHIKNEKGRNPAALNTVWVSCEGENPADVENMGPVQYFPRRGFPGYYYPFENTPGYLSPLVAVYFERPKHHVLINIECKAWARNIHHDRYERRGSVHFELLVD